MTDKDPHISPEEISFDKTMRALVRVPKAEVEELEKQEAAKRRFPLLPSVEVT